MNQGNNRNRKGICNVFLKKKKKKTLQCSVLRFEGHSTCGCRIRADLLQSLTPCCLQSVSCFSRNRKFGLGLLSVPGKKNRAKLTCSHQF